MTPKCLGKKLLVMLLRDARSKVERGVRLYSEISQIVSYTDVKEALEI